MWQRRCILNPREGVISPKKRKKKGGSESQQAGRQEEAGGSLINTTEQARSSAELLGRHAHVNVVPHGTYFAFWNALHIWEPDLLAMRGLGGSHC